MEQEDKVIEHNFKDQKVTSGEKEKEFNSNQERINDSVDRRVTKKLFSDIRSGTLRNTSSK